MGVLHGELAATDDNTTSGGGACINDCALRERHCPHRGEAVQYRSSSSARQHLAGRRDTHEVDLATGGREAGWLYGAVRGVPPVISIFPPTKDIPCPSETASWLPCTVMAPGFDPRNPNAATGALEMAASCRPGNRVEPRAIRQAQIISRREAHRPADIQGGIRAEDNPGRIH